MHPSANHFKKAARPERQTPPSKRTCLCQPVWPDFKRAAGNPMPCPPENSPRQIRPTKTKPRNRTVSTWRPWRPPLPTVRQKGSGPQKEYPARSWKPWFRKDHPPTCRAV